MNECINHNAKMTEERNKFSVLRLVAPKHNFNFEKNENILTVHRIIGFH